MRELTPTPSVLEIARRLEAEGFAAWCVGGAIRDALLGGAPLDWDLATPATPEQVRQIFGRRRTIPVGIEFGTVSILDDAGVPHEITTFRHDVKTDGRHAVVEFGASLEEDLARRDFTINAIAYRPHTHELRDPFGGQADLQAGIVRAVGEADERMREDRLRALRAIRFASRYEFRIDGATLAAIRASSPHLTRLSAERVQQELVKTMEQVRRPGGALRLWRDLGALEVLVPALGALSDTALATLDEMPRDTGEGRPRPQRTPNRLAALFLDVPSTDARAALLSLRFSKHDTNWVAAVVERWEQLGPELATSLVTGRPTDAQVRRWLSELGRTHASAVLRLALARWRVLRASGASVPDERAVRSLHRRMRRSLYSDPIALSDLAIGGDDLRRAGIRAGPIYAKILHALLERVLEDPARNTPDALLAEVPRLAAALSENTGSAAHPSTEH
jgi:tRNA nucleotidyltransferase (CCA-adding enzyme)